jgi:hypothetical protein
MTRILALDIAGTPFRWLEPREAISFYAADKVAWELGAEALLYRGGVNRSGRRSVIAARALIALAKSEAMVKWAKAVLPLSDRNDLLFERDRYLCAYCARTYPRTELTRDHVLPKSRGGRDVWENVVTACRTCNSFKKRDRTPAEAGMQLVYLPYAPCRYEHFILSGRNILADQMDYLLAKVSRSSRMHRH